VALLFPRIVLPEKIGKVLKNGLLEGLLCILGGSCLGI